MNLVRTEAKLFISDWNQLDDSTFIFISTLYFFIIEITKKLENVIAMKNVYYEQVNYGAVTCCHVW